MSNLTGPPAAAVVAIPVAAADPFTVPPLSDALDALEPCVDKATMEIPLHGTAVRDNGGGHYNHDPFDLATR